MSRPIRSEYPGALYHVTVRGNRRGNIFLDEADRLIWLELLASVCARYNFVVHAFCQMSNHFHLVVETVDGELGNGMRQLNSTYSQRINRRHKLVGHLLQGRYHAILVQKETYLLALARYVVLNPVRAGMVRSPDDWAWSSHLYLLGIYDQPPWLEVDWLLERFGDNRTRARQAYVRFIRDGKHLPSPLRDVKHQIFLGDEAFLKQHRQGLRLDELGYTTRPQRRAAALTLADYARTSNRREEAMARALWSTAYSMREIAAFFNTSTRTVHRAIIQFEGELNEAARQQAASSTESE